ncbi:heavy metal transporter [Streptomyces sp. NPDC053367]|uniref:heavy metal transporter n=1 Tax=Streptomyces sp. NPDC053367 TaxID=3365700 RepID=UPI0037D2AF43
MSEPSPTPRRRGRTGAAFLVLLALAGYLVVQYDSGGAGEPDCRVVAADGRGEAYELTPEQAVNAAAITAVGVDRGLPERAVTIALATALQESALRNIEHGDRDSLGLFQQRPSQGWGTPRQIMDPAYAAGMFYAHLEKVPGYTGLPLTDAAQRVQRSGFPLAYAKHEHNASLLAAALTGRAAATLTCEGRPAGAVTAKGPNAVRDALVRDFGRDAMAPAGAEVGAEGARGAAGPVAARTSGRTVSVPAGSRQRGWQLAHWAVANASALRIERVTYAGREWTAGTTDSEWRPAAASDTVRIVTAQ